MNKTFYFIIVALCLYIGAHGQINESDTSLVQVQLRSGGSYQTGNVEFLRVTSQLNASSRLFGRWVVKTQNDHLYQAFFANKADNDISSRNYLYFNPQGKIYPYAIGFVSTNFRRKIDTRSFGGLGLTYQMVQQQHHSVKLSGNVAYEASAYSERQFNYGEFDGSNQIKATWMTLYLSGFHSFNESALSFYYELYWQQSLADQINYRYHLLAGADFRLFKGLALQSRLVYAYENVIASSVKQNDMLWVWGLTYGYKSKGR